MSQAKLYLTFPIAIVVSRFNQPITEALKQAHWNH